MDLEKWTKSMALLEMLLISQANLMLHLSKKSRSKKLSRDFQDLNIRLERAKEDKNNAEIKQCETDIKRVKDDF